MISNRLLISKNLPGASVDNAAYSTSGLIAGGVAVAGKLVLGTSYKITNAAALAELGLNASYDTANGTLAFYHASEFFRMCGDGNTLWLMVVAMSVLPADICTDVNSQYAKKLFNDSGREIRRIGIAYVPVLAITGGTRGRATISATGLLALATGASIDVVVDDPVYSTTYLGTYYKDATDTTAATLAANIALAIGTQDDYTVTASGTNVLCDAPLNYGATANGKEFRLIYGGGSITNQFAGGVDTTTANETLADGFNAAVRAAIVPAQALHIWAYESGNTSVNVLLEGRKYSGNSNTAIDLTEIPVGGEVLDAHKVSIVIAQDFDFATTLAGALKYHAAIGSLLGSCAAVRMEQCIAEVEEINLTNATLGKFVTVGLSNHVTIADAANQLDTLDDKRYIFAFKYYGVSGNRWNDDHVCTKIVIDEATGVMNEHTIALAQL